MHPLTAPIGVTIAALLWLAGCSGQPDSPSTPAPASARATTPSASTGNTPTSAASPTPPALPEAAKRNDEAGQLAFIEHWWDLYNYAIDTGNIQPLMAISDPDEPGTKSLSDRIHRIFSKGSTVDGGHYRVLDSVRVPLDDDGITSPTVSLARDAGAIVSASGVRDEFPADDRHDFGMVLVWKDSHWMMYGLGTL